MGARGYYAFYFRGRFYVYYNNHFDSYPDGGLGEWIMNAIPKDPERYQEFLDSLRAWFHEYDQLLENDLLTFGEDDDEPWHKKFENRVKYPPPPQCPVYPPRDFEPGKSLECLPSPLALPQMDMFIEWIYVVDLDREEFRVDSKTHRWCCKLDEIPGLEWFTDDGRYKEEGKDYNNMDDEDEDRNDKLTKDGGMIDEYTENGGGRDDNNMDDEAEDGNDQRTKDEGRNDEHTEQGDGKDDEHKEIEDGASDSKEFEEDLSVKLAGIQLTGDRFSKFHLQHVVPKRAIDEQNPMRTQQFLRRFLFRQLAQSYCGILARHVLHCQPQDFIYREFAFAILSLAAGQFSLLQRTSFALWSPDGISRYESNGSRTLLPAFGRGIHKHHVEPGSAPNATTYWFDNILVSLDNGLGSAEGIQAAVTKAIQFAEETGRRSFHGLIFSLPKVVLIRVQSSGVVEFTGPLPLLTLAALYANSDVEDQPCEGFIAMTYLFNAALGPSQSNAGSLSDDIYHQIMDYADWKTRRACARVSRSFEQFTKRRIWLDDRIIRFLEPCEFKRSRGHFSALVPSGYELPFSSGFKVLDTTKPTESEWFILPIPERHPIFRGWVSEGKDEVSKWHLVIGDGDRLSFMSPVALELHKTSTTGQTQS